MAEGVTIDFNANLARFEKSIDKATSHLSKFQRDAETRAQSMRKAFSKLGITASVTALTAGLGAAARQSLAYADKIAKTADSVGIAVESLQEYRFAANRSGIETAQLDSNMTAFVKRVGEARAGIGPLTSFLKKYDATLLENIRNSKNQEEALDLVANAIQRAGTDTDRAAIANAAFSRSGIKMVNALRGGSEGLADLRKQARNAGYVLDESLIRQAEVIDDRWSTLSDTIGNKFKAALISSANASLNFLKIYNDLDTVLWKIVEAEEALLQAETEIHKERGRNRAGAIARRDQAKKDLSDLREQEKAFREMEERINAFRISASAPLIDLGGNSDVNPSGGDTIQKQVEKAKAALLNFSRDITREFNPADAVAEQMSNLEAALAKGFISPEVYSAATFAAMDRMNESIGDGIESMKDRSKEDFDSMNEFATQAARNMQSQFADFLFNPFDEGLKGLFENFANTLRRMAAEAASQQILTALFNWGAAQGGVAGEIASVFGEGISRRAIGGDVKAGSPYWVGERGERELFVPDSSGTIIPGNRLAGSKGGTTINISMPIHGVSNPAEFQASQGQIMNRLSRAMSVANRRR